MSEWMPIETAPKNGAQILLWTPAGGPVIAPWFGLNERRPSPKETAAMMRADGEWPNVKWNPTHWMPLPAAPK